MKVFSAGQIKAWDKYTIASEPISSEQLMERAATRLYSELKDDLLSGPVYIFCGTGNNGGDGLVIARLLHADGVEVRVFVVGDLNLASVDFKLNFERCSAINVNTNLINSEADFPQISANVHCIDALFGSGLNRALQGGHMELVHHLNNSGAPILSVDVPSGMQIDLAKQEITGVIKAQVTYTFQRLKYAFLFAENNQFTGDVKIVDIGLSEIFEKDTNGEIHYVDQKMISERFPVRRINSEKRDFGSSLIIGGSQGMMGAMILATRACIKSGSGLTTSFVPGCGYDILQTAVPEAMSISSNQQESHKDLILDLTKFSAIGIGPGLGMADETAGFVRAILECSTQGLIIDADALNHISRAGLQQSIPRGSLITPHKREFERLFGVENDEDKRMELQRKISEEKSIYILYKGPYSKLTTPTGELYINSTGNPGLAKGGSGDVLTGLLTGLLARTGNMLTTAVCGMYLHGLAADLAVNGIHEESLTATDIIDHLPTAFKLSLASFQH